MDIKTATIEQLEAFGYKTLKEQSRLNGIIQAIEQELALRAKTVEEKPE